MKSNLEQELQRQLRQEIEIPECIQKKSKQAYLKIKSGQIRQEEVLKTPLGWMKKTAIALGSVAAALLLCMVLFLTNPVMAQDFPVIGNLFSLLQDKISFFGNFEDYATPLVPEEDTSFSKDTDSSGIFSKTEDGLTITLSEVYANTQAIYLTVLMESEEAFPSTLIDQQDQPVLSLIASENYDFNPTPEEYNNPIYFNPEGQFLDAYTYSCILRLDLREASLDRQAYNEAMIQAEAAAQETDAVINYQNLQSFVEIPEQIHLDFQIQQVIGTLEDAQYWDSGYTEEELTAMTDEEFQEVMKQMPEEYNQHPNQYENYWFDGPWDFSLDLTVDSSRVQTIEINEINENGVGISNVILTPYELTVNDAYADGVPFYDYFLVALDANGNKLPYNDSNGNCNYFTIQDRDISTVDLYILDYTEYMDELKGEENYNNNENKPEEEKWSTLLDDRCFYHTTLNLTPVE